MKRRRQHCSGGRRCLPAWQCLLGAYLLLLLLSAAATATATASASAAVDDPAADNADATPSESSSNDGIGSPHSTVIDLTNDAFDEYLSDPSNGLWFLKFYGAFCAIYILYSCFFSRDPIQVE